MYDEVIATLQSSVEKAKLGQADKHGAIKKLTELAQKAEAEFVPQDGFEALLQKENDESWKYGGRTAKGRAKPPNHGQLDLFGK